MQRIFDSIEQYDIITLFRHQAADSDALGAQFGLKQWIMENYPQKQVYALGESLGSHGKNFPAIDHVNDDTIRHSLAIILDTANTSRIDDERWKTAEYKIKIDHHIFVEQYADFEWIEDYAGATCEILANALHMRNAKLSKQCAEYLYGGMIADTLQFSIPATTPQMLRTAAYLVEQGVDVAKINELNFSKSLKEFTYENYLRTNFQMYGEHVAYCKIRKAEYEQFSLTLNEAKEKVYVLGHIQEIYAWALFVEIGTNDHGDCLYNASLRSRDVIINDIATKYHGGGHRYACGAKNLTDDGIDELLSMIAKRVEAEDPE